MTTNTPDPDRVPLGTRLFRHVESATEDAGKFMALYEQTQSWAGDMKLPPEIRRKIELLRTIALQLNECAEQSASLMELYAHTGDSPEERKEIETLWDINLETSSDINEAIARITGKSEL